MLVGCVLRQCSATQPGCSFRLFASAAAAKKSGAASQRVAKRLTEFKPVDKIRNVGISAHIDSGKTTVTERILFYSGRIDEMHEVRGKDKVGATMDFMELERQRGITIQSAATYINWKQHNINIIDTPGHVDFTVEVERSLRVLDGAILVLCAVGGVQSQTHTVSRQMARYDVPFIAFINKLDRTGADAYKVLDNLRNKLKYNTAMLQMPIGQGSEFAGIIDVIHQKALYFDGEAGETIREEEIPEEYREHAAEKLDELIEMAANGDNTLCELYMDEKKPNTEQLIAGIQRAVLSRSFVPVLVGSALKNKGVQTLMDHMLQYLPNPAQVTNKAFVQNGDKEDEIVCDSRRDETEPFVGMAFKLEQSNYGQLTYMRAYQGRLRKGDSLTNTREKKRIRIQKLVRMHARDMEEVEEVYAGDICAVFGVDCASGDTFTAKENYPISLTGIHVPEPVVSMSIEPDSRKGVDNFMKALQRFTKEDPTFTRTYNHELKETIVSGMGELHLEIYAQRMANEYNCPVTLGKPKVAFREVLVAPIKFDHLRKYQTGGRGQFGHIQGVVETLPHDQNLEVKFSDDTIGGCIPRGMVQHIKKGFFELLESGPLIGQKVTGIHIRLQDGKMHEVDSTEIALLNTAKGAMQEVYDEGRWRLLEPIMKVEVVCPQEYMEPSIGGIMKRAAVITNQDGTADGYFVLTAEVPLNNMFGYTADLRKITAGKGEFIMEFARYAPMDATLEQRVIKEYLEEEEKLVAAGKKARRKRFDM